MINEIGYGSHEEWLEIRRGYIGGSEAGAVLGLDEYKSPLTLWAEKTGRVPPFAGNLTTTVGSYLEELVAKLWCDETGKKVRRKNRVLVNDAYPFACADVDRLVVGEKALLEIKTTNSLPVMKRVRGGDYPEKWYCQMVHYLAVTGLERAYLAVLVNCRELLTFTLERDEGEIAALMQAEEEFWAMVREDREPAPDGTSSSSETISTLFPGGETGTVDLMGHESSLRRYAQIKGEIKALDQELTEIENRIKVDIGNCEGGQTEGFKVLWKPQERRTLDAKRLAAEHPELDMAPYYKVTVSRPFKVTATN
ncbi:MAG: hypothetical protein E7423_01885 [Ruminococcaceae bacterium]|jgi:putative phage-type endonuclease|nr:hypothetical protein [Oscillospiraceae bacterium]